MSSWINNSRTIGYSSEGSGVPILAFHGTTQAANAWSQVQQVCSANLEWVTFEFPGSGESDMPTGPIDLDVVVSDAVALMNHLGHKRFHVIGYSLGAVAALQCAALFPDSVITVTSLCGWSKTDARMKVTFDLWRRLIAIDRELFMRYALADGYTAAGLEVLEPMIDAVVGMAATTVQPGSDAQLELDIRIDIEPASTSEQHWIDDATVLHAVVDLRNGQIRVREWTRAAREDPTAHDLAAIRGVEVEARQLGQ